MSHLPTVFLIDPDRTVRDSVRNLTQLMELGYCDFDSGQDFLETFDPARSGCLVLEIRVPGINGLQIQQRLRDVGATLPIVFVSTAPSVSIAVHAMRAGAVHFLEKPLRENDLWKVIQEAIDLDGQRRQTQLAHRQASDRIALLTEKELNVLELIGNGQSKHAMAQQLGVSVRTIEHHRTHLMRKLQTNSLAGLMQIALSSRNGHPAPRAGNYRLVGSTP